MVKKFLENRKKMRFIKLRMNFTMKILVETTWKSVQGNKESFKELFGENFSEVNTDKLKQTDPMPAGLVTKVDDFTRGYIKGRLDAGEFADKSSKEKLDAIVKPYLTVYSIKNSTTIKEKEKDVKNVALNGETPKITIPKVDVKKVDSENNSMKIVEEKIADILKEKRVNFYKSRAKITKKGRKTLDEIIVILKKQKDIQIEVQGHTDASGRAKINQWISSERAKSVKHYLVNRGLNPKNITAKGFGETKLLLKNRPYNAINRRVEIKIKRR